VSLVCIALSLSLYDYYEPKSDLGVLVAVRFFHWGRVLDLISAQLGRAAAMLDGDLPPDIADDVAAAGLDLLPGAGEIGPRCSCPDDADPCKHAAAVFCVAP